MSDFESSSKKIKKAVALKYPEGVEGPIIVAKGEGKSANHIIKLAKENQIQIEEDAALVDLLGFQSVGSVVPEESWKALAAIFSFIMEER